MKVVMYPAITLDRFIADINGECYSWISEQDEDVYMDMISKAGCALIVRKTFDQYRSDFPHSSGAITLVLTTDDSLQDEEGIKYLCCSPKEAIKAIEDQGFSEVIISGGGDLNGALASEGLVTEIIASIYPVTLGGGIRLFGNYKPKLNLDLISTSNEIEGIVKNHYRVI